MAGEGQTPAKPKKKGRTWQNKGTAEKIELCVFIAAKGLTDEEIARVVGCSVSGLNKWKLSQVFKDRYQKAKDRIDDVVQKCLLSRARGLKVREVHEEALKVKGKIVKGAFVVKTVTKWLPPDPVSCIFWLKNRRRAEWRDQPELVKPVKKYVLEWGEDEPRDSENPNPIQAVS